MIIYVQTFGHIVVFAFFAQIKQQGNILAVLHFGQKLQIWAKVICFGELLWVLAETPPIENMPEGTSCS